MSDDAVRENVRQGNAVIVSPAQAERLGLRPPAPTAPPAPVAAPTAAPAPAAARPAVSGNAGVHQVPTAPVATAAPKAAAPGTRQPLPTKEEIVSSWTKTTSSSGKPAWQDPATGRFIKDSDLVNIGAPGIGTYRLPQWWNTGLA